MNKICISEIYQNFLDYYDEEKHNSFIEKQVEVHSVEADEVENLLTIHESYHFKNNIANNVGIKTTYDDYTMMCFKIFDQVNKSRKKGFFYKLLRK